MRASDRNERPCHHLLTLTYCAVTLQRRRLASAYGRLDIISNNISLSLFFNIYLFLMSPETDARRRRKCILKNPKRESGSPWNIRALAWKKKYLKKNSGGNQSVSRVLFRQDRQKCQRVRNDFWSEGYFYWRRRQETLSDSISWSKPVVCISTEWKGTFCSVHCWGEL